MEIKQHTIRILKKKSGDPPFWDVAGPWADTMCPQTTLTTTTSCLAHNFIEPV